MAEELMYIPNDDTQNYPFCRQKIGAESLNTELNKPTNQNSRMPPKLLR